MRQHPRCRTPEKEEHPMPHPFAAEAAHTLAICDRDAAWRLHARLQLPEHENLRVEPSTDTRWFHLHTPHGQPAVWDVLWLELVAVPAPFDEVDYDEIERHEAWTFAELPARLTEILECSARVDGSAVDVQINEWALHYLLPLLRVAALTPTTPPRGK
jgi:hypothetical protein